MKLATLAFGDATVAVRASRFGYVPIPGYADVGELLQNPDWARIAGDSPDEAAFASLDAPPNLSFPSPGKIVCVGLNYRHHILEMGRDLPEHPTLFAKFADTLTGPDEAIPLPSEDPRTDWEGELAVVVGRTAYRITPEDADEHIAGYTIANDISMRGWQNRTLEWLQGKIWARSTPIGPVMVTREDFDASTARIETRVNGEVVQQGAIADMVFSPQDLVAYISTMLPLRPGDLILTGTPGGIGHARQPATYLLPGDDVTVSIDGIGTLASTMVNASV